MLKLGIIDIQGLISKNSQIKFKKEFEQIVTMADEISVYFLEYTNRYPELHFHDFCLHAILQSKNIYTTKKIDMIGVSVETSFIGYAAYTKPEYDEIIKLPASKNYKYHTQTDAVVYKWILDNSDIIITCHYKNLSLSRSNKTLFKFISARKKPIYNLASNEIQAQINNFREELPTKIKQVWDYYDLGMSYNEIGKIYSLTSTGIRKMLYKAHLTVAQRIKKYESNEKT